MPKPENRNKTWSNPAKPKLSGNKDYDKTHSWKNNTSFYWYFVCFNKHLQKRPLRLEALSKLTKISNYRESSKLRLPSNKRVSSNKCSSAGPPKIQDKRIPLNKRFCAPLLPVFNHKQVITDSLKHYTLTVATNGSEDSNCTSGFWPKIQGCIIEVCA